jgi:hypothetical protein
MGSPRCRKAERWTSALRALATCCAAAYDAVVAMTDPAAAQDEMEPKRGASA